MDEDAPHRTPWPRLVARAIGYPLLAIALYVLSVGPAVWAFSWRSDRIDLWLKRIYVQPLALIIGDDSDSSPAFLKWWQKYLEWWVKLPGGPEARMLRQTAPLPASQPVEPPLPRE